ncbi:winged helix DNA-binding domain-containing protein [Corynebacterium lubricantis]|uniref:winged helix DNA-binding domain-containing protein n=1 Tax=Corynebacterium lubricantis TaxID=541095 RepID=UPI0003698401|nr:winged helix DNA-binding domain-containing protein [Corynebacterium lubricantis]
MKPRTKARSSAREKARTRLVAQGLVGQGWDTPAEALSAFGLMQGQDPSVFSSMALRSTGQIQDVHEALDRGEIVRGYPMRGTVFAARAHELRWLTELLANPGVERARKTVIEHGATNAQIDKILDLILTEGPVTNQEYQAIVTRVIPDPDARHFYRTRYLLMVDGSLAYLGREQKMGAAPSSQSLEQAFNGERQAAADEIVARYVRTHGPVTFDDVRWWSKLPVREIRTALEHLPADIIEVEGEYMRASLIDEVANATPAQLRAPHLLPAFDEYILGYQDRLFAMSEDTHTQLVPRNMGIFKKAVVVDGVVRGAWRGNAGKLEIDDYAGIPNYAQAGIRRKHRSHPFF